MEKPDNQIVWDILFGVCLVVMCLAGVVAAIALLFAGWALIARCLVAAFCSGAGAVICNSFRRAT